MPDVRRRPHQQNAKPSELLPSAITPTSRDPDDDHVLACALSAEAEIIVTRDRDLLMLGTFRNIRILAAHDALVAIAQG